MLSMAGLGWIVVPLAILGASSDPLPVNVDPCLVHKTCGECIKDASVCSWCAEANYNGLRCKSKNLTNWCSAEIDNPINSVDIVENVNYNMNPGSVIQIMPQKYKLKIRPGLPAAFNFSFKYISNYPVDLYFLLDASKSMKKVHTTLKQQIDFLYNTMKKLTSDVQMGMGTFIDKNTLPYTNVFDSQKTYSFRNHFPLINDSTKFKTGIEKMVFGENFDSPEGGLDGLAQVLSCQKVIGWRHESRKIVIFLTNGPYHLAGDGLEGGILQPYDGQCYVNEHNIYTKELEMDYPSISILKRMAADKDITIIFMVDEKVKIAYYYLNNALGSGSKSVSYDTHNTAKISKVLIDIYREIAKTLKLKVKVKSGQREKFDIRFNPDCTADRGLPCVVNEKVPETRFNGTITLLEHYGVDNASIDISIEGINEKLTLDIDIISNCDCANRSIASAPICNKAGKLECGVCKCDANRYGDKCACIRNSHSNANDNSTCKPSDDKELCNGHGSCICGNCICRKPYEGKYCQFNKDNCPRNLNGVCNGKGRCEREHCICTDQWRGDACECPTDLTPCTNNKGQVCNNRGTCPCGACICDPTAPWDAREHQDEFCHIQSCPDCNKPQCNLLKPCATCLHARDGPCEQCGTMKTSVSPYSVLSSNLSWTLCSELRVDVGCYTRFMYRYSEDMYNIELVVQSETNCQQSYYLYGGLFLVSLILIGVATLVAWKWLTDAKDRREYIKFLKEHEDDLTAPCSNNIYMNPTTTIHNPAFRKPSVDFRN